MGNAKQEPEREELEGKKRAAWQRDPDAERPAKATVDQPSKGLKSQGEINMVPANNAPKPAQEGMGKRSEPTRHDAMEIAGHKRLPGYDTPVKEAGAPSLVTNAGPKVGPQKTSEPPELEAMAKPEIPDLKEVALDADRELKHSSEDAEADRLEGKDDEFESEPLGEQKERDAKVLEEDSIDAEEADDAEEAKG